MKKTIRAAVYETHGNPADVISVVEQPWPTPADDEAVVQMQAAPLNPADLNAIEGKYPVRPTLPATPGMEGAGVVVELGCAARDVAVGDRVIVPHNLGTWREACAVKAEKLVVVPIEIEPVQAAMLKVNPITAWRMLHDFVTLQPGDWFIQNAANSAAGRAAIQIGREVGYKSVNIVRRAELVEELRAEGGGCGFGRKRKFARRSRRADRRAPRFVSRSMRSAAKAPCAWRARWRRKRPWSPTAR